MLTRRNRAIGCVLLILCLMGVLPMTARAQDTITVMPFETVSDTIGRQPGTTLTVGNTTAMGGHFGTEAWSLNTADMDVRALLHGYTTVSWTRSMGIALNGSVVEGIEAAPESDGSRTYVFQLFDDLKYSDGSPVTAKDYVFSLLLNGSQALREIGGTAQNITYVVGYEAYSNGQSQQISGLRLLSDTSFSLTIDGVYLPFFYGMSMLNITPYPMSVIAPGCDVKDDGYGAYIADGAEPFSAAMLERTLLDPSNGYEFFPRVTTGPYKLEAYDATAKQATFVVNDAYKGNYEGKRPNIERIVFKHVRDDEMMAQLENGEVNLLNKVSNPQSIAQAEQLIDSGSFYASNYLRTGLVYLSYACEEGPTASVAVRNAIGRCIDVDALVEQAGGKVSRRVYGYYGLGQWMASFTSSGGAGGADLNIPEELAKLAVDHNLEAAKALLVGDGWTLNASGEPFVEGTDTVRYRMEANGLTPLIIRWAKTEPSATADVIEQLLAPNMAQIGMQLDVTRMPFDEMLTYLYRQQPRTYNMFYLATNFSYIFDPYYDFHVDDMFQGIVNTSGLKDETLMRLGLDMRETVTTDMAGYVTKWLEFQKRFVELMPMTPLFSSVYFDVYTKDLQGYDISGYPSWALAVLYTYFDQ